MNSTIILLAGGAALLYYLMQGSSLPSDAVAVSNTPLATGATVTVGTQSLTGPGYVYFSPSTGSYYVNSQAPTAAQLSAGATLFGGAATTAPPTATGTPTNPTPVGPAPVVTTPAPAQAAPILASVWSQLQA